MSGGRGSAGQGLTARRMRAVAEWSGELVVEGGGFCGVAAPEDALDLAAFDGIALRVQGGGETFKFNIKTSDQARCPTSCCRGAATPSLTTPTQP